LHQVSVQFSRSNQKQQISAPVHAEITSSSDLNCDFSSNCLWRNASSSEDNGDWIPSTHYEADPQHVITPRKGSEGFFAHTIGFMGRTVALLVSDVASCQLGGGNVKYWYYKTGVESQLEVCTRQPPGSKDLNSLKCYDGLSPSFAQQWIFRVVELPPLSQPFELVFRGTFYPPMDVIALTDIVYSSALCDAQNPWNRKKRLTPHLIGIHDWQQYRQSGNYRGETMIIVSQDTNGTDALRKVEAEEKSTSSKTEISRTEPHEHTGLAPSSTIAASTTTMSTTTEVTTTSTPMEFFSTTESPAASTTDALANFMNLLRQTAPVLPYIPVLVKTLQSVDLANQGGQDILLQQTQSLSSLLGTGTSPDLRRSPVQASHFYNTDSSPAEALPTTEPSMVQLARKLGILDEEDLATTVRPMLFAPSLETSTPILVRNIYGMQATTAKPELAPTLYPPSLVKNTVVKRKIAAIKADAAAIQQKSNEELQRLHSKLFKRNEKEKLTTTKAPELLVFKKPTPVESEVATKLTELTKYLPTGVASDLSMLREIPDLEGLTRGMDLTLVSKPGGFAKLKKQFVDRLMRRTMGLPYNESGGSALPPPIVPVKVTRKMMRERSRKVAKRLRKSRV
ncbi:hypothetical protein ANCCAN_08521, partial [Ancylostoma caninum]